MSSTSSIFSTYKQGENRVTSTILAVLERLNTSTVTKLIQRLTEEDTLELVSFTNQYRSGKDSSVPDGRIVGYFDYYIETKIRPDEIKRTQLRRHLEHVESSDIKGAKLLVLTPDAEQPAAFDEVKGDLSNVFWANFDHLVDAIESMLASNEMLLADREEFLLVELKHFIQNEGLLADNGAGRVIVVPASRALGFFKRHKAYVCQPNRSFQKAEYMAFYKGNKINQEVPLILGYVENLNLQSADYESLEVIEVAGKRTEIISRLKELVNHVDQTDHEGFNKIFILSSSAEEGTVMLEQDIRNDKKSASGGRTAFVQGQRYVNIEKLKKAKTTSELENRSL